MLSCHFSFLCENFQSIAEKKFLLYFIFFASWDIFVVMMISFISSLAIILAPLIMFSHGGIEWKALCGLVPVNIYAYFKVHQDISEVLQYISILAYYAADKKCK